MFPLELFAIITLQSYEMFLNYVIKHIYLAYANIDAFYLINRYDAEIQ